MPAVKMREPSAVAGSRVGCPVCDELGSSVAMAHGLMAMCLAVLPVLLLSRRRSWRGLLTRAALTPGLLFAALFECRFPVPLPQAQPSLAKLCVLRT